MNVYTDIHHLPKFNKAVITIGTFDGVHLGHSKIIEQLIKEAHEIGGTPVLITFYPHPKLVIDQVKKPLFTINTPEEKYALLHQKGIEHIVVVPFDRKFAEQPALDYIRHFLVEKFHPHTIIIGYDHRFGNNREGDYQLLEREALKYGFKVKEIPEHVQKNITISSTRIREALLNGNPAQAAAYLGYPYFFTGKVIEGNKLGRTIGFPTANLAIGDPHKLIPAMGVYAVTVAVEDEPGETYKGMMNIGMRPTVDGTTRMIEVNLFDFDRQIYGLHLTVTLHQWIRPEQKFSGLEALKTQLAQDKRDAAAQLI